MKVLARVRRYVGQTIFDIPIDFVDEIGESNGRIIRPVTCQNMIEVNIGQDAGVATIGFGKTRHTGFESGMRVSKAVDRAVTTDSFLKGLRKGSQLGGGREIGQEISYAELGAGVG